jgi:tetratricopeptide (TPR) repeat protein
MPSNRFALAALVLPLLVYVTTLAPSVTLEDSGEYLSVAETFGIAHPPGAPLWTLLAGSLARAPFGTTALKVNLFSAVCGALACYFLYAWVFRRTGDAWTALAAAGVAAFSRCVWGQCLVAEIYALNLAMIFLCFNLVEKWRETERPAWLFATALAGGLGAGNHHLLILVSPVVLARAFGGQWKKLVNPKLVLGSVGCLLLGLSVYLYLPIRSAMGPPILWEKIDSVASFWGYFSREMYKTAEGGLWYAGDPLDALQFFFAFLRRLPAEQGGILVLFALPGLVSLWKKDRVLFGMVAGVLALNVPVLLAMGTAQYTPTSAYINRLYYLPATAALAVPTVFGWKGCWEQLFFKLQKPLPPRMRGPLVAAAVLFPFALNWSACDRSDYTIAQEYGRNLIRSLPEGGAVFPLTNNEGFTLMYYRFVEKDPRAWLLDERFGWDGERKPKAVFTAWPVGKSSPHPLGGALAELETWPDSILYRAQRDPLPEGLQRFSRVREVEYSIGQLPGDFPRISPFERMIFASYSAYYAGLGAKRFLQGNTAGAEEAWRRAEELNPEDAYCSYLLGWIYRETGARSGETARERFRDALDRFEECYDPLDTRFYGVKRETIEADLRK